MNQKLIWANKKLGQHFLKNEAIIDSICNSFSEESEAIIEVGPGPGILTKNLVLHGIPYVVVEKDSRFIPSLEDLLDKNCIRIVDALRLDIQDFLNQQGWANKKVWLVSNLPYNIGIPLLMKFMKTPSIKLMTLMFQKEVGEKIYSESSDSSNMNSLRALCCNYFDCQLLCRVRPDAFVPPPKVDSIVMTFKRIESPEISLDDFSQYEKFLRFIFAQKRKQLGTILKSRYEISVIEDVLEKCGIDRKVRAETFNLEQIRLLYNEFCLKFQKPVQE